MANRLVTTRYTTPGVYIGQLIVPSAGNLSTDARICDYIGKGSRLAVGSNLPIRRSFIYEEMLSFPSSAPFESPINYPADGIKDAPTRVFDTVSGRELRSDQWEFTKIGNQFYKVLVAPDVFEQTASYAIDYQSVSRTVVDPLPVAGLRTIRSMGANPDRAQYKDYSDFFIPFIFTGPTADAGNSTPTPFPTSVFPDAGNTGAGTVAQDTTSEYTHMYNRFYEVECISVGGVSGTFNATFKWKASLHSGGINNAAPVPLHSAETAPSFTAIENIAGSLVVPLEYGIKLNFTFAGTNFIAGDKFYFNGVGPGIMEFNSTLLNTNQYVDYGAIVPTLQVGSTGVVTHSLLTNYTSTFNSKYKMKVINAGGSTPTRFVTVVWAAYGDILGSNGSTTVNEASPSFTLSNGITLDFSFGGSNFAVNDVFNFTIKAPRTYFQAKDDRVLKLTVASATNPGADAGTVTGSYATGTPEGGFGTFVANINNLIGIGAENGYFMLPDGISIGVRNAIRGNINGTSFAAGDKFEGAFSSTNVINWSLEKNAEEIRETSAVFIDVTGLATGTAGTPYIALENQYNAGSVMVVDLNTLTPISFFEIANTRYIGFFSIPTAALKINYRYMGEEPSPGQLYYLTANYLRPMDLYENPTLVLDKAEGRTFLAPAAADNHLHIMNELAFENGAPGAMYTQPYDGDGDGIINRTDVQRALDAHKKTSQATDLCLLSLFESLPDALAINEQLNDPFEKKEQNLWVGAPIGTPIGNIDLQNSLTFIARRTMQTTPQSPALGTRILVAPTECRKTIQLENNTTQQVRLDGSFVAGATSALVNSFTDPATTILRKQLAGFDYIQTYTEPENLLLGGASITYMKSLGGGSYRFEEDITVHTQGEEFQLISASIQKQFVTKVVRREMDNALISVVLPSAQSAVALIRATLSTILFGLLGRGLVADYQDEKGNVRQFDPNKDIVIIRDSTTLTKYDFFYAYWIRSPIKRLFGLYRVNSNDFGQVQ